jgi:broad specificity phosphatase PhoE
MDKIVRYLLRHGDTELNDGNVFRGMLDPPLNDKGLLQASKAAEFLKSKNIERVICSPLLRAVKTARIVSGTLGGRCVDQTRDLFPWQIAPLYGADRDKFDHVLDYYIDNPKEVPDGGESLDTFVTRVGDFFDTDLKIPVTTLYVCHTSNIVALNDLLNEEKIGRPESGEVVGPGGICEIIEMDDGYFQLKPVFGEEKPAEFGS